MIKEACAPLIITFYHGLFAGQMLFGGTAVGLIDEADKWGAGGYGIIFRGILVNGVLG